MKCLNVDAIWTLGFADEREDKFLANFSSFPLRYSH